MSPVVEEVIVIAPVDTVQVGSTTLVVGTAGTEGAIPIETMVELGQPDAFCTARVWSPDESPGYPSAG